MEQYAQSLFDEAINFVIMIMLTEKSSSFLKSGDFIT